MKTEDLEKFTKDKIFRQSLNYQDFTLFSDAYMGKGKYLGMSNYYEYNQKFGIDDAEFSELLSEIETRHDEHFRHSFLKLSAEEKVNLNQLNFNGQTPLMQSLLARKSFTFAKRVEGYDKLSSDSRLPEILLELKADPDIRDSEGYTALTLLIPKKDISTSRLDIVFSKMVLLIKAHADVNVKNSNSCTPLMALMQLSYFHGKEFLTTCLEHKANVNLRDSSGSTALHFACLNSRFTPDDKGEIVSKLLSAGAQFYIENKQGNLPSKLLDDADLPSKKHLTRFEHAYTRFMGNELLIYAFNNPFLVKLILSYLSFLISLNSSRESTPEQEIPQCGLGSSSTLTKKILESQKDEKQIGKIEHSNFELLDSRVGPSKDVMQHPVQSNIEAAIRFKYAIWELPSPSCSSSSSNKTSSLKLGGSSGDR